MKIFQYILISVSLLLSACSSSEEPSGLTYKLSCEDTEDVTISDNKRDATVASHGGGQYKINITGDFVNVVFDSSVEWASASYTNNFIIVNVSRPSNSNNNGYINFTVFNDDKSASGKINVKFEELTYDDLLKRERKAIDYFLKDHIIATTTPTNIAQFQVGEDAPFYYIDDKHNVAMRILSMGNEGIAENGDMIIFRYMRYNLMSYFDSGIMPNPEGNYDAITQDVTSFIYNDFLTPSSAQWGKGIQLPLQIGVPIGSTVQLVMTATEGPTSEISYATPYLYQISYYLPENTEHWDFPPSRVYIPFFSQAEWNVFGVASACTWRFFSMPMNKPANFNYGVNTATGFGGVFLFEDINGNVLAVDAACPVEAKADITIWLNSETGIAKCSSCGSEYDLFQYGGQPISGKAMEVHYALKQYTVHFNVSGNPYAVITNNVSR